MDSKPPCLDFPALVICRQILITTKRPRSIILDIIKPVNNTLSSLRCNRCTLTFRAVYPFFHSNIFARQDRLNEGSGLTLGVYSQSGSARGLRFLLITNASFKQTGLSLILSSRAACQQMTPPFNEGRKTGYEAPGHLLFEQAKGYINGHTMHSFAPQYRAIF